MQDCMAPAYQTNAMSPKQKQEPIFGQQHHPSQGQADSPCQGQPNQYTMFGNWLCPRKQQQACNWLDPTRLQCCLHLGTTISRTFKKISNNKHVRFAKQNKVHLFSSTETPIMVTFDSGADGHYISKKDHRKAGLPIIKKSTRRVGVANGGVNQAKFVTQLPSRTCQPKQSKPAHSKTSPHH